MPISDNLYAEKYTCLCNVEVHTSTALDGERPIKKIKKMPKLSYIAYKILLFSMTA